MTASGIAAACTRPLTAAAPASMAEPPMRLRREIMTVSSSLSIDRPRRQARAWRYLLLQRHPFRRRQ